MRVRALITLFLGVSVAGSAVAYVHNVMRSPLAQHEMQTVVVTANAVSYGKVIDAGMLTIQSWPADAVPEGTFSSLEEVLGTDDKRPRRAKLSMAKGEVLFNTKISDFGERVTVAQQIDPTMRAVAIRVDDVTGVAGLISPADRIDLTLTRTVDNNLVSSTILQDVEVLGIDKQLEAARNEPATAKTVTVQVTPGDAQRLALAQQAGTLSLSLRNIDAADRPSLDSISVGDLVERSPAEPARRPLNQPSVVVNRAGARSTIQVPSG